VDVGSVEDEEVSSPVPFFHADMSATVKLRRRPPPDLAGDVMRTSSPAQVNQESNEMMSPMITRTKMTMTSVRTVLSINFSS
jgi:hypothetical protein